MTALLDYLVEETRVDYMSDLKVTVHLKAVIKEIDPANFPIKDWNQAVQYLCKNNASFKTVEEAKEYLIRYNN